MIEFHEKALRSCVREILHRYGIDDEKIVAELSLANGGEAIFLGSHPEYGIAKITIKDKRDIIPGYDEIGNRFEAWTTWVRAEFETKTESLEDYIQLSYLDAERLGLPVPLMRDAMLNKWLAAAHIKLDMEIADGTPH